MGRLVGIVAGAMLLSACSLLYAPDSDVSGGLGITDAGPLVDSGSVADANVPSDAGGPALVGEGGSTHPYVVAVLADKPVLYLRFGDTLPALPGDPQVRDEVSGMVIGTRKGTVVPAAGAISGDQGLDFRSGALILDDRLPFLGNAPYTIELWASWRKDNFFGHMVTKQRRDAATKNGYALFFSDQSLGFERYASGSGNVLYGDPLAVDGVFHHIAATYDAKALTVFVDGKLYKAQEDKLALGPSADPLIIGSGDSEAKYNFFAGLMDEVAIYDKALDSARIAAHYAAGK